MTSVVVVGGGLAGLRACETLRGKGYDGAVTLLCAEPHLPYSRPPLSKEVLRGDSPPETAMLRTADDIAALDVDLRLGARAVALDVAERTVRLDGGDVVVGGDIVIATGARARGLPGAERPDVHVLRSLDDAVALHGALTPGARVVVVGAGFIGLEVAASATAMGCAVSVVEPLPKPLARVLDPRIGAVIEELHRSHGVDVRCGVAVAEVAGDSKIERVVLSNGDEIGADVVVVGIGVVPETDWLTGSGLTLGNGIRCDETLQAAPHVWAIGDVCEWWAPSAGRHVRVEHWTNAAEQATHVVHGILGDRQPFDPVPYFWSDQYDAKLQVLGYAAGADELAVVRGSLDEPKWVALLRRGDRLAAVAGLRSAGAVMRMRSLVAAAPAWDEALAAAAPAA